MKFKVGDRVKVKDNSKIFKGEYAGKEGMVSFILVEFTSPYGIDFDDESLDQFCFHANELELI